jgi:hypothetical protein
MQSLSTPLFDWEATEAELDVFVELVSDAIELATHGCVAEGYTYLLRGIARADRAEQRGEAWAPDLKQRYQEVLCCFRDQYGILLH